MTSRLMNRKNDARDDWSRASLKISAMHETINDPLFLADLNEAMEDFAYADAIEKLIEPKAVLQ